MAPHAVTHAAIGIPSKPIQDDIARVQILFEGLPQNSLLAKALVAEPGCADHRLRVLMQKKDMELLGSFALRFYCANDRCIIGVARHALMRELLADRVGVDKGEDRLTPRTQAADIPSAAPEQVLDTLHRSPIELPSKRKPITLRVIDDTGDDEVVQAELLLRPSSILVKDNRERRHPSPRRVKIEAACPALRTSPSPR